MVLSKQDLDKHTANVLGRIKAENERNSRGYHFAKLYYGIEEYDVAKRYLAGFLSLRSNFAPAYKLMGQIQEGLDNVDQAVAAYKRSLDLDERQRDVVISICEIYCKAGVDPDRAQYWSERAEKMCPGHAVIFRLRENMVAKKDDGDGADELETLITSELVKQPKNPELRAKLLHLYMETGRVNEAYTHAVELENKNAYLNSLPWCNVLLEVLEGYQKQSGSTVNGAFHQHLFTVHARLVALSLQTAKIAEIADALYKFDQSLASVSTTAVSGPIWETFYELAQAQYYSYAGHLLLKRAQQDHISWADATNMAAVCYLASYSVVAPNLQTPWVVNATNEERARYTMWHDTACFRRSEAGHLLTSLCDGDGSKWASKVHAQWSASPGRRKTYDSLFTLRHMKGAKDTSFFMTNDLITAFRPAMPSEQQLREIDRVAHLHHPGELRNLVWLALHSHQATDRTQSNYGFRVFEDLQYETGTALDTASPETLSQLDTQAFLYATVHNAAFRLADRQRRLRLDESRPRLAPLCFGEDLCSAEQTDWWQTAYNLHTNRAREELGRLRLILQRGIETVRLIGNHGISVSLVLHLARVFTAHAQAAVSSASIVHEGYLQDRAALYWTTAVDMLERLANNKTVWSPKKRLFPDEGLVLSDVQVSEALEEGHLFLAVHAMHCGQQEDAIQMFDKLRSSDASFHQAQIYRSMADDAERPSDGEDSLQVVLLTKARDALYTTLDRISGQRHHKLTMVLPTEIDDVESKLNRLITGTTSTNESRRCSDEEVDGLLEPSRCIMQGSDSFINTSTPQRSSVQIRTPILIGEYTHTRPSPERMDAQMRSLVMSQEVLIKQLIEQNEELKKQNNLFTDEITKNREEIEKLKTKVETSNSAPVLLPPMPSLTPGSPAMHHPGLDHTGLRPAMPPTAASPYGYPGYRPHEYDFAGGTPHPPPPPLAAYSPHPHGYPLYGPPPPMPPHYPYPPPTGHQLPPAMPAVGKSMIPKVQSVPAAGDSTAADEEEDYYVYDEEDYRDEEEDQIPSTQPSLGRDQLGMQGMPVVSAAGFTIPDSQLIHDWPYGNNVNLEGKSTLTYSPTHPPMPPQPAYFPQMPPPPPAGPRPAVQPPAMYGSPVVPVPAAIGPGFFSSPERPNIPAFGGRFQSPTHLPPMSVAGAAPSVMVGLPGQPPVTTLNPPKPGFLPPTTVHPVASIGSNIPPPNASLTPSGAVINPPSMVPPISTGTSAAALTGGGIFKVTPTSEPAAASSAAGGSPFGTKFIMTMPAGTSAEAKPPASLSAPITFNFGLNDGVNPSTIDNPEEEEDDTLAGDDGYQGPDFEPIIPLPDEVEVVTGEEDEVILFNARTKLFRFIENQWKERGLGEIKILHDNAIGRVRIVMRREQVHKVCANHSLNSKMTIDFKSPTEKNVLSWQAMDFAEGESHMEKFCAKFKSEDIALQFKEKFEEGVKLSTYRKPTPAPAAKTSSASDVQKPGLFDKFKPKAGTWACDTCMVNNTADLKKCIACTTPRPGATPEKDEGTKVTMAAVRGFNFGSAGGVVAPASTFVFGGSSVLSGGSSAGFAFSSNSTTSVTTTTVTSAAVGSSRAATSLFGNPAASGFSFGSSAVTTAADNKPSSKFKFTTPSAGSAAAGKLSIVFGSSGTPSTPSNSKKAPVPAPPAISPPKFKFTSATSTVTTSTSTSSAKFSFGNTSLSSASTFKVCDSKPADVTTTTPAADMLKALANKSKPVDVPNPKATNQLGGFTFTSTPVISPQKSKEEKPKEPTAPKEEAKVSPFAGFSFGKSVSTTNSTPVFGGITAMGSSTATSIFGSATSQKDNVSSTDDAAPKAFGSDSGTTSQTFGSLIKDDTAKPDAFTKKSDFKGFSGAGSQLFTAKTPKSSQQSNEDGGADDEYEPDMDFQPIIPLPDLVATETGEENEEKLFSDRVKLFRHDQDTKQWKERGVGEIKILKHKETNRCRLVMRREQVLKICCNQIIASDIKLQKMATSDKAWCWLAQDFSEGEVKIEQFAVRFKSIDSAARFKDVYEAAAQLKITDVVKNEVKVKTEEKSEAPVKEKSLKDLFKPTEGEWQCEICYVKTNDHAVCPACATPKPGVAAPKQKPQPAVSSTVGGFKFNSGIASKTEDKKGSSLKSMFMAPEGEWQCDACYVKSMDPAVCPACMTPKPGADPPKAQPEVSSTSTVGGFKFAPGGGFKFGTSATTEENPKTSVSSNSTKSLKDLLTAPEDSAKSGAVSSTTSESGFGSFKFGGGPSGNIFSFGKSDDKKEVSAMTTKSGTPFSFTPSSSTSGGLFGKTTSTKSDVTKSSTFTFTPSKSDVSSTTSSGFVFGKDSMGNGAKFSFSGVTPSKPLDLSATRSPKSPGEDGDFYVNQDGDDSHIYFEPIVQLEKVEVKTGEEDEEVMYCHRAKLFLFCDTEWKERGLGDVKILKHKDTKKRRIIMRRDQVHKLCLNHYVTPDLELVPMANSKGKAWVWHADDFIDNEVKHEQLAIRFKDEDTAAVFHEAFIRAQEAMESLVTPTKDLPTPDASTEKSKSSVKQSLTFGDAEQKQAECVQSSQVTSSESTEPSKPAFGASPAFASFSFKPSSLTTNSKPAVFGATPVFGVAPPFGTDQAFGTGKSFSFGSTGMSTTGALFGGVKESPKMSEAPTGPCPLKAKSLLASMLVQTPGSTGGDDDVVFLFEKCATPEQISRARKLQLPDHFYLYEEKEPCPGCLGCDDGEGKMIRDNEQQASGAIEETITMIHANITGKDGNPYYAEELDHANALDAPLSTLESLILPKTASVTGDKGNTYYTNELERHVKNTEDTMVDSSLSALESMVHLKTACVTGDKGNIHYAKELERATKTTGASPFPKSINDSEPSSTTTESPSVFGQGKKEGEFSFAAVAAGSDSAFRFGKKKEVDSSKPFTWQGAGSSLFKSPGLRQQGDGEEDEDGVAPSDDIHFEPIVSLPEIEVKTGEEDEDVLYSQRSKLFRFDPKQNQWKERGVGEMKLLKHRKTGKIRVLMRREQVLKLACNHALTTDMSLIPLQTSEVAWCWFALDIAEGEPRREHLAIKFKTPEIAAVFKEKFEECQAMLVSSTPGDSGCKSEVQSLDVSTCTDPASPSGHDTSHSQGDDTEDYEDYGEEEEDEDLRPWFTKRCTMMYGDSNNVWQTIGMGELEVSYDDDVNGARVTMATDNDKIICNHIICREYSVQCNEAKRFCEWTAKDFSTDDPVKRTFRVQFSSKASIREYQKIFEQGRELAVDSEISESPDQGVVSQELYK